MTTVANKAIDWTEAGIIPDTVIRHGIRRLLRQRLAAIRAGDGEYADAVQAEFVAMMNASPIALVPDLANEQHYEVPAEFFDLVLGRRRKYSCCYWPSSAADLDAAEVAALSETCTRARIADGMTVLDLGCGWGSLSLWIAAKFPGCRVTAVSNSRSQHDFIVAEAKRSGLANISVIVADMNDFDTNGRFDRIVSVEMFEHMHNYGELFSRISRWLETDGRFFMHIFCHRSTPYEFVDNGPADWMSRHFFSGGIMPSDDLPLFFQEYLSIEQRWRWDGRHYARTSNAWLRNMDQKRANVIPVLADTYGKEQSAKWWMRWRIFFMACAELFDFNNGQEWYVAHYLFRRNGDRLRAAGS